MLFPRITWREVLLHVLTDHLDLAVWSHCKFVLTQLRIVATEVLKENRDWETSWALQVTLAVSGAKEEFRDLVVVTDLWPIRIVFLERVAADVAFRLVLILRPLLGTHAFHRSIRPELLCNRRFLLK